MGGQYTQALCLQSWGRVHMNLSGSPLFKSIMSFTFYGPHQLFNKNKSIYFITNKLKINYKESQKEKKRLKFILNYYRVLFYPQDQ